MYAKELKPQCARAAVENRLERLNNNTLNIPVIHTYRISVEPRIYNAHTSLVPHRI